MTRFVLDPSVVLAWLLDDPVPLYALEVKKALRNSQPLVPELWVLEVANALTVAERRGNLPANQVDRCGNVIEQLMVERVEISTSAVPFRQVLETARSFRLTAYDTAYLEVARKESIPLATLDNALRAAATRAGVKILCQS